MSVRLLSPDYIVFSGAEEAPGGPLWPPDTQGPYFVVDEDRRPVSEFDIPELPDRFPRRFWKAGPGPRAIVADRLAIRTIDLATGDVTLAHEPLVDGYEPQIEQILWQPGRPVVLHYNYMPQGSENSPFSRLIELDETASGVAATSDWPGNPHPSPDGRYVAYQSSLHDGPSVYGGISDRWPVTTICDSATGAALFRVRSFAITPGDFVPDSRWLADSSGIAGAIYPAGATPITFWRELDYAMLGLDASLSPLPTSPDPDNKWFRVPAVASPVPSPGDVNLLSFGRIMLYRRDSGRFYAPIIPDEGPQHLSPWGRVNTAEMRFSFPHGGHGGSGAGVLLPSKVEYPPFDDALAVRVSGTGSCLNLRAAPALDATVLDCLVDGTRLALVPEPGDFSGEEPGRALGGAIAHSNGLDQQAYARVMTANGIAGWVAIQYLEWM